MKHFLWLSLVILSSINIAEGYFMGTGFVKKSQKISIEIAKDKAKITQTFVLKNDTNANNKTQWFETQPSATNSKVFVNLNGSPAPVLTTSSAKANVLWDAAQNFKELSVLQFFSTKKNIVHSNIIEFDANEEKTIKTQFETTIPAESNLYQLALNNQDEWTTEYNKIHIFSAQNPNIFYHFLSTPKSIHRKNDLHAVWENEASINDQPTIFVWSYNKTASAGLKTPFGKFMAHFKSYPPKIDQNEINIVLDTSGSMSDGKWEKIKTILPDILSSFPNSSFKIGAISNTFQWWNESFEPYNESLKKTIYNKTFHLSPLGKINPEALPTESADLNIFITDESSPSTPVSENWIILHLGLQNQHPDTEKKRHVHIFPYAKEFIKKEVFANKLQLFRKPIIISESRKNTFPKTHLFFQSDKNPVFWERDESVSSNDVSSKTFWWTMPFWSAHRVNELISESQPKKHRDQNILSALLSIGKNFGLETRFFNPNTSQKSLQNVLWKTPETQITAERNLIKNQNTLFKTPNLKRTIKGWSYKNNDNIWTNAEWAQQAKSPFIDTIEAFSTQQEALFKYWPEKFGSYFSLGELAQFCVNKKCFQVQPSSKNPTPLNAVKLFVKHNQNQHWADEFIYTIAQKNALEIPNNHNLNRNKKMTRGSFAHMAARYANLPNIKLDTWDKNDAQWFPDVPTNHPHSQSIYQLLTAGVIKGYQDGYFYPEKPISRAEALKILFAVTKQTPYKWDTQQSIFADTHGWKKPWANLAYRKKIVVGVTQNGIRNFLPNNTITLGEAAKILVKVFEL